MPTPERDYGSVRRYGKDAVSRLRFIKRAQALGFSLDEVKLLSSFRSASTAQKREPLPSRRSGWSRGRSPTCAASRRRWTG
jgi:MerR family mercuric resistance operon transcriptional regulator